MSHKGNQGETHIQLTNAIVGKQLQEPVNAENRTKLAQEDSQKNDQEQHSEAMLMRYEEELKLLETLLRDPESKEESSVAPGKAEMFGVSKKAGESLQSHLVCAGMRDDETKVSHEDETVFCFQQEMLEQEIVLEDSKEAEDTKGYQQTARDELEVQGKTNAQS